jgi:hypothetical protein
LFAACLPMIAASHEQDVPFPANYIVFPHDCLFLTLLFYQNHLLSSGKKRK